MPAGDIDNLLVSLLHLPCAQRVNSITPALISVEAAVLRELIGAHEREKIRVLAGLEQFARLGDVLVLAAQALEQVAPAHQRGAQRGGAHAIALRSFDEDARVARMHRQAKHLAAGGRQLLGLRIDRAQRVQQLLRALDGLRVGLVEPVERHGLLDVHGMQQQDHFGQVRALDFRRVALRTVQVATLGPETMAGSRSGASGAAFALVGGGAADFLDEQGADAALGIVPRDARLAAIHDVPDAVDGHGRFGDVGRNDDLAERVRRECEVLLLRLQFAVQRNERESFLRARGTKRVDGGVDLAHAWHEHEDVARLARIDDALDGIRRLIALRPVVRCVEVIDFHREALAFGDENRAITEISGHRLGIERGGHHHDLEIGPLGLLKLLYQRERDVAHQVALVELVEEEHAHVGQRAVVLEPAQQDAFGHETDARAESGLVVETDLVADFPAEFDITLPGDTRSHRAGSDAARLQHDDLLLPGEAGIEQHLRHLRGLAGAGRRDQHEAVARAHGAEDAGVDLPDGKIRLHGDG